MPSFRFEIEKACNLNSKTQNLLKGIASLNFCVFFGNVEYVNIFYTFAVCSFLTISSFLCRINLAYLKIRHANNDSFSTRIKGDNVENFYLSKGTNKSISNIRGIIPLNTRFNMQHIFKVVFLKTNIRILEKYLLVLTTLFKCTIAVFGLLTSPFIIVNSWKVCIKIYTRTLTCLAILNYTFLFCIKIV
jgi:hypothetical protein